MEKENKRKKPNFFDRIKEKIGLITLLDWDAQKVFSAIIPFKNSGKHKFHLRVLKDGRGILIIDASFILYLNHMAMIYIEKFIEGKSLSEIQEFLVKHYRTTREEVSTDYGNIMDKLERLITTEDAYPLQSIGFAPEEGFTVSEFPIRVDLAVTYKSQENESCYKARDAGFPELDTEGMTDILERLWEIGVPHIALTGGEPTMREDFIELIEHGQKTGFVMGMLSNGIKFADPNLVKTVVKKGLDYIQITIHSHDATIHNKMTGTSSYDDLIRAIKNIEKEDLFFMTTTTLTMENIDSIGETVRFLDSLNVKVFACNGLISSKERQFVHGIDEEKLRSTLEKIEMIADELDMQFIWYSPTQYATSSLVDEDFEDTTTSAANSSITIEPNGDVLPCQTIFESAGNIFKDKWDDIWDSELFRKIRKNEYNPPKVDEADLLTICNGGSPLHPD